MIQVLEASQFEVIPVLGPSPLQDGCRTCAAYRTQPELDGNLRVDPEIRLPSPGMDVEVAYYYNANSTYNGPFGYGRTLSTNLSVQCQAALGPVSFLRGNGALEVYQAYESIEGNRQYAPLSAGCLNTLAYDSTNSLWKETTRDGRVLAYPYDITGQISSIVYAEEAAGNRHTFLYSAGLLVNLQDAVGRLVTFSYDGGGLLSEIRDWADRRTTFQYDSASVVGKPLLTTVIGPTGCQTAYGYDSTPLMTRITDPNGYDTTYTYWADGRIRQRSVAGGSLSNYTYTAEYTAMTDALGATTTYLLRASWYPYQVEYPNGLILTQTYNGNAQPVERVDGNGGVWSTVYLTSLIYNATPLWPMATVDPLGNRTSYLRDSFGNATTVIYADSTIWTMLYGYGGSPYDETGVRRRLQAVVDPLGNRTSYLYNGRGQLTAARDPLGNTTSYTFDAFGNRTGMQDPLGNLTSYSYDLAGNVIAVTDPLGRVSSTSYDPQNRPLTRTNPLGQTATLAYDSVGNLVLQIDPLGNRTSTTYNVWDRPVAQENPLGNRTTRSYDATGRQVAVMDPLGAVSTTVYDLGGQVIANVDALGFATTVQYDSAGREAGSQDALGNRTTTVYDLAGRMTAGIDPLGIRSSIVYDVRNRIVATVDPLGFTTSMAYDAAGRLVAILDALGRYSTSVYDALGRPIAAQDALGYVYSTAYDAASRPVAYIDPLGYRTTTIYDAAGQMTAQVDALGYSVSSVYDAAGQLIVRIDQRGNRTTTLYDAARRVTSTQEALNGFTTFGYDAAGRRTSLQDPSQPAGAVFTTVYDAVGRPVAEVTPRLTVGQAFSLRVTTVYDAVGQVVALVDGNGHRSTMVYDGVGWTIAQVDGRGCRTSFSYDGDGRRTVVLDANGHATTMSYDARGLLLARQDALGRLTSYQYDAVGNASLRLDARGIATSYTYDELGRQTGALFPDGGRTTNAYDARNLMTLMADRTGLTTYSYDARGLNATVQYPGMAPLSYSYDAARSRSLLIDPDGGRTTYSYDAQNRLSTLLNPFGESTAFVYDKLGRTNGGNLSNGMGHGRSFDAAGRETQRRLRYSNAFGGALATQFDGTYDKAANRLSQAEIDGSATTYTYDAADQLLTERRTDANPANSFRLTYTYDNAGNRTKQANGTEVTTYSYDAVNQLSYQQNPDGTVTSYSYDAAGNRSLEWTGSSLTTYAWDEENRLTSMVNPDASIETCTYAADGLRRKKVVGASTTNFVWDAGNVLQEKDGSLITSAQYTGQPADYRYLVSLRRNGVTSFYATDLQDNVRALFPTGQQPISDTYLMTAFGVPIAISGTTVNPYRFEGLWGYYYDTPGRVYVRARYFAPAVGKWLSQDPLVFLQKSPNSYLFVLNRPSTLRDPTGLWPSWSGFWDWLTRTGDSGSRFQEQRAKITSVPLPSPDPVNWKKHCLRRCVNTFGGDFSTVTSAAAKDYFNNLIVVHCKKACDIINDTKCPADNCENLQKAMDQPYANLHPEVKWIYNVVYDGAGCQ